MNEKSHSPVSPGSWDEVGRGPVSVIDVVTVVPLGTPTTDTPKHRTGHFGRIPVPVLVFVSPGPESIVMTPLQVAPTVGGGRGSVRTSQHCQWGTTTETLMGGWVGGVD